MADSVSSTFYTINGMVYTRVTTVLDVVHNEGLAAWKHKVGLEEAKRIMEEAAAFGTRVHTIIEGIHLNPRGYVNRDEELDPYYLAYSEWYDKNVEEVLGTEVRVRSELFKYAGTYDMKLRMVDNDRWRGRVLRGDVKTNKSSVSTTARLQLSAYDEAEREMGVDEDEEAEGRLVIWMPSKSPGKLYPIEFDDPQGDVDAWYAALKLFRWRDAHKNDYKRRSSK